MEAVVLSTEYTVGDISALFDESRDLSSASVADSTDLAGEEEPMTSVPEDVVHTATGPPPKLPNRANMKGEWFEVKMAALLFLRGMKSGCDFQLATNVIGAGALDDIVFRFKSDGNLHQWQTCFVQLKHKQSAQVHKRTLLGPRGDFSLNKYLSSFAEIRGKMSDFDDKKQEIFDGPFDLSHCVIYTNATVTDELRNPARQVTSSPVDSFLQCGVGSDSGYVFNFTEEADSDLYSFVKSQDYKGYELLPRLRMFTGQPNEEELGGIIKSELRDFCLRTKIVYIDLMYRMYEEAFKLWWQDSNACILDNRSSILLQSLHQAHVESMVAQQEELLRLDITFDENSITGMKDACAEQPCVNVVVSESESIRISSTKLLQILADSKSSYICVGTEYLVREMDTLVSAWCSGTKDLLVIVNNLARVMEEHKEMFQSIIQVLKTRREKRFVLVSSVDDPFAQIVRKDISHCKIYEDCFLPTQLDLETFKSVLEKQISLQGYTSTLGSLLGVNEEDITRTELKCVISRFLETLTLTTNSIPSVGNPLPSEMHYYIPRILDWSNAVKPSIFSSNNFSGKIVVTGLPLDEVDSLKVSKKMFRESEEGLVFDASTEEIGGREHKNEESESKHDTHYLNWSQGNLFWKKTQGDIEFVTRHIDENVTSDVVDPDGRVVLLVSAPGMGKSTFSAHVARQRKRTLPSMWVICISLNDHSEFLSNTNEEELNALEFLTEVTCKGHSVSSLDRALLQFCLLHSGNILVMLDGFDEIAPKYVKKCCRLVSSLLETKVKQIWLTSRHSMKKTLERHLSSIALTLKRFTVQEQRDFLTKFWETKSTLSLEKLSVFITNLLENSGLSLRDDAQHFTGIPLHINMLAEVYYDQIVSVQVESVLPKTLDMIQLLEQFVQRKLAIYLNRFYMLQEPNVEFEAFTELQEKVLYEKHMFAALKLLWTEEELNDLHSNEIRRISKEFFDGVKTGKDKSGIVDKIIDDQPVFLHRVYAEYFAAVWFSENYNKNQLFLERQFYTKNFGVVQNIFDRLLSRHMDLHTAVINAEVNRVATLLAGNLNVNATDAGGRTALHVAVTNSSYPDRKNTTDIIKLLLQQTAVDIHVKDDVLEWTPVQYAVATNQWDLLNLLSSSKSHDFKYITPMIKDMLQDNEVWEKVIRNNYVQVMRLLLDIGLDCNSVFKTWDQSTLLHKAAEYDSFEIASLLIERGSDVSATDTVDSKTPLHVAVEQINLGVAQLLIQSIPDEALREDYVNKQDAAGNSAVFWAVWKSNQELIGLIVESGGDVTQRNKSGNTPLISAARLGCHATVRKLLDYFHDKSDRVEYVNMCNCEGQSAICMASQYGHNEVIYLLIEEDSKVINVSDVCGWTPLMRLASDGRIETVRRILLSIADSKAKTIYVNRRNNNDRSALYLAAESGFQDITKLLMEVSRDRPSSKSGLTSLMQACASGSTTAVQMLLGCFADEHEKANYINQTNSDKYSAVHIAILMRHYSIAELLVLSGGHLLTSPASGWTLLMTSAQRGQTALVEYLLKKAEVTSDFINKCNKEKRTAAHLAAAENHDEVIRLLAAAGADFTCQDDSGWTPLMTAARYNYINVLRRILHSFSDKEAKVSCVKICNGTGINAIYLAAREDNMDVLEMLINSGGDILSRTSEGWTPLMISACNGNRSVVELLIRHHKDRVDVYSSDEIYNILDALFLAFKMNHFYIANFIAISTLYFLENLNIAWTPLMITSHYGHTSDVKSLLLNEHKFYWNNPNYISEQDPDMLSPMSLAAKCGRHHIVEMLIQSGANLYKTDVHGFTPLMTATCFKQETAIEMILRYVTVSLKTEYVNIRCKKGFTALHIASKRGFSLIVELLVKSGGNILLQSTNGRTPLISACYHNHKLVAEQIIRLIDDERRKYEYINHQDKSGDSAMHLACQEGFKDIVEMLITTGCYENRRNSKGSTPLMTAALNNRIQVVELLLQYFLLDANARTEYLNVQDDKGDSALHLACKRGYKELAKILIDSGGDLKVRNKAGQTPLMTATLKGHYHVVQTLLEAFNNEIDLGDVMDGADPYGALRALYLADKLKYKHMIELLITANNMFRTEPGHTLLMTASKQGLKTLVTLLLDSFKNKCSRKILKDITSISKDSYVNERDSQQRTAIFFASSEGHHEIVKQLVDSHSSIIDENRQGWTPLMYASLRGNRLVVELLLGYFHNIHHQTYYVNRRNVSGDTALSLAARSGHNDIVRILIDGGGTDTMSTRNNSGWSSLMFACQEDHQTVVETLLQRFYAHDSSDRTNSSGNRRGGDHEGLSPLVTSCASDEQPVVGPLLETCSCNTVREQYVNSCDNNGRSAIFLASRQGSAAIVQLLVNYGAYIDRGDDQLWTPLMIASCNGHKSVVDVLLDSVPNVDEKDFVDHRNVRGSTAMSCAAKKGHLDIVQALATCGASMTIRNDAGWTPLMLASEEGRKSIVEMLLNSFDDGERLREHVNIRNDDGRTSLMWASRNGHLDVVMMLIVHGSDVTVKDNASRTALMMACKYGHAAIVAVLLQGISNLCFSQSTALFTHALADVARVEYINALDLRGNTAISLARSRGHGAVVDLLVSHGGQDAYFWQQALGCWLS